MNACTAPQLFVGLVLLIAATLGEAMAEPSREKVILDVDVGIDDAMAILFASKSPEIDLLGVTTVFGNASIEDSTRNALFLVARCGLEVPVAQGASVPLVAPPIPPVAYVHGRNGLGNVPVGEPSRALQAPVSAAEFIIAQSRLYPGELTLVPVGRLTNIALALRLDPTLPSRIKRIVLMGGAFDTRGNITPVAGANTYGDPHAADIVFQADWDVTAVGTDVTRQVMIDQDDLDELARRNPLAGGFVRDMTAFYLEFHRSIGVTGGFYVHDPTALIYLVRPDLFEVTRAAIRVVTDGLAVGQTIAAPYLESPAGTFKANRFNHYTSAVDHEAARALLLNRLAEVEFVD